MILYIFFFSSRRRHTRFDCDWSSDVCSSDLTEELLQRKKRFTALMAFDDLTALGAIRALTKAGVKVPEYCSVVGFDDVPLSSLGAPSLTTVRQPLEAMGNLAVNIVMEGVNAEIGRAHV